MEIWKKDKWENIQQLKEKLLVFSDNYVIQEIIKQHDVLSRFNNSSVNPVRIMTLRLNDKIIYLHSTLRFGTPGAITDIRFEGGKEIAHLIKVNPDGTFGTKVYNADGLSCPIEKYNINQSLVVPNHGKAIEMAIKIHEGLQHFDLVGSDITITSDGQPLMIEYNVFWPGITFPQFCNGPLFGDLTETVISSVMKKRKK